MALRHVAELVDAEQEAGGLRPNRYPAAATWGLMVVYLSVPPS
jgi:hypothetical protein